MKTGDKVVVVDRIGRERRGVIVSDSLYRLPSMRYAVDVGDGDYWFVGRENIRKDDGR